jgi:hypothetical protein
MKMYSQQAEEKHILAAFPDEISIDESKPFDHPEFKKSEPFIGRFLDIGAWHPTDKSNSRALFERGWSGIVCEPSPGPCAGLVAEYGAAGSRVIVINALITIEPGLKDFFITDDALSSIDPLHVAEWKKAGAKFTGCMKVNALPLRELFNQFGGKFDFVNIDAETMSVDLMMHMLFTIGIRPQCLCVEHDGRTREIFQRTCDEYRSEYINDTNVVLVRR